MPSQKQKNPRLEGGYLQSDSYLECMVDYPRITIITVVYNGANSLDTTIRSVLSQTYEHIDYFIIDGGSTDGTVDLLYQYNNKIAYWISEPDKGIYDAMNKGWSRANDNSFVLFLGTGDQIIHLPEPSPIYDSYDVIYGKVDLGEQYFHPKADMRLKVVNSLHHQGMLVRKSLCPTDPFNTKYKVYADFDFNQRLLKQRARFVFSDHLFSRMLPGGISHKHYMREYLQVIVNNFGVYWGTLAFLYSMGYYMLRPGFANLSFAKP